MAASGIDTSSVATPPTPKVGVLDVTRNQGLLEIGAHLASALGAWLGRPVRVGSSVLVARYADVREVLARDLEFRIAPVNAARIQSVNGPFVLGMDRDVTLNAERDLLYRALHRVDLAPLRADVARMAAEKLGSTTAAIDAVADYARPIASATATSLFGIAGSDPLLFMDVARSVFNHIFLNLGGDKAIETRAIAASKLMGGWLREEIAARRRSGIHGSDMMGALLDATCDDDLVRRTLGGMFVGSVDTTASSIAKILAMIGKDAELALSIARESDHLERVAGYCWEALRRWPHNPILLRQAVVDTAVAGTAIRAGDKVVLITQAAMLDASVFPAPLTMNPARPPKSYLHFGGGLHPCAGRAVNDFQIPLLVQALVRRGIKSVGPIQWAGPFPDHLAIAFNR